MAREEAEASRSLHLEVEEEALRDLGNRVQSPSPVISITTTDTQLNPASLFFEHGTYTGYLIGMSF